jgi:hydroxypyruvate isomerase
MSFLLAVCAEMVHRELPVVERARLLHERGFAVEIWDWTGKDLPALAATGARFTSMTGYVDGSLTDPEGADALLASAERSVAASRVLGSPNLNLHGTGLDSNGLPVHPVETVTGAMWLAAVETLGRIADLGRREGVVFSLENLNTAVDHPGTPFGRAADTAALVAAVDNPHLRMNLIELVRDTIHLVGEIQVADVPGRCEPGTGEIRYPAVAAALAETGYDGVVAMEAWASGDSDEAVEAFRRAFTVG